MEQPEKRVSKPTSKAQEEKLQQLKVTRKTKLGYLTRKIKEIEDLMEDDGNFEEVSVKLATDFSKMYIEFCENNDAVKNHLTESELLHDQTQWYEPKASYLRSFVEKVERWLKRVEMQVDEARMIDAAEVEPADSASAISSRHSKAPRSSQTSFAVSSTSYLARLKIEAERAALVARAEALKQKMEIDRQEAVLKAKREEWELQTAIAAASAKLEVLTVKEPAHNTSADLIGFVQPEHGDVYRKCESEVMQGSERSSRLPHPLSKKDNSQSITSQSRMADVKDLLNVMKRQNEIIELLVKQQKASTLPPLDVPVFSGDPLEFGFFMKAFEHGIEERTDSNRDRLRFLEQFTQGRPKVLVRSCSHMHPDRGYAEAKRLLRKHFGDEYTIASAYIERALKWPVIKPEDGDALTEFAMFLTTCCNTVDSMEYIEEMDSPTNMRTVIFKLPFKLRERWRGFACDIQERTATRARFTDLVSFVEKQAKIASHPLFGNIQDTTLSRDKGKPNVRRENALKFKERESIFATNTAPVSNSAEQTKRERENVCSTGGRQCLFCHKGGHNLNTCRLLKQKSHREKLDFLKSKSLHTCETCSQKHPTILHKEQYSPPDSDAKSIREPAASFSPAAGSKTCGCTGAGEAVCALSIVPVKVRCSRSNATVESYAFLDPGSTGTFCTDELMRDLHVTGKRSNILLCTMGKEATISTHVIMGLEVSGLDEDNFLKIPQVFTQAEIPVTKENIPQQSDVDRWPYLKEVQLKQIDGKIGMLIGTNVPKALEPWKVINSEGNGPYAVKTALGWTINGPLLREEGIAQGAVEWPPVMVNRISVTKLEELSQQQMKYDFPEHELSEKMVMSARDRQFMESVSLSVKQVHGHYTIGLPLKNKGAVFPNNRVVAVQRAEGLKRRLLRDSEFHQEYTKFMTETLERGYAEEVPVAETSKSGSRIWYLPHHGVYHPTKHKLRVVFDCASTYQGMSLNSQLLQGPDLTNSLIGVLIRFRQEPVAFMSDIEGMFHQVRVPAEDADLLRFLWWPQGDLGKGLKEYRMVVHLFGATCSPSCACYALQRCAEDNQARFNHIATNTVLRNLYVDDCLKSVGTEEQAISLIQDLRALCAAGGFKLTKWISNSRAVLASIPEDDRAKEVKELDLERDCLPIERALMVQVLVESKPLTRRGLLSMVSTIYDPLGILSPLILPVKHILQELSRTKHAWDDIMPEALSLQWQQWVGSLHHLARFEVDRCVRPVNLGKITSARLHHFADASERGYGIATYLVSKNNLNQPHSAFIIGKARVTPLKPVTIPRLELTAAVVAAKMDRMVRAELELELEESVFWTDSTSVIKYLKNETARFRTFIANRVAAIKDRSAVSQWRYVNTSANPADFASRGLSVGAFLKAKTWITGPDFITKPEMEWPEMPDSVCQPICNDPEVKEASVYALMVEEGADATSQLIHHYSSWHRVKRAVAWVLRLKGVLKLLAQKRKDLEANLYDGRLDVGSQRLEQEKQMTHLKANLPILPLSVSDMAEAEVEIVRFSQGQRFGEEIAKLQQGKTVSKDSPLCQLSPVVQDGILRVGGRLSRSSMQEEIKHPAILAKDQHIATLILRSAHEDLGHGGRNHVLSKVRQKYWILRSHAVVRKILSQCVVCRRHHGKAASQIMADLPTERLTPDEPPFTSVGVDYFGPFEVKRGRSMIKRYGVVFTCLTVRAVHIELANSLDTDSCIHALRRFIARRGQVQLMRSDNGTNFVSAERELREAVRALDNAKIHEALLVKGIIWIFNPAAASHFGGVWERQIRSIRKVLSSVVEQQILDEEGLHTLLCEVEAIINSRPISRVSTDPNDLEALTPNHLLLMKAKTPLPPGVFSRSDIYSRRRWRQVQYLADLFWRRWIKEYLPDLQKRQKWALPQRNISQGNIVLIVDDSAPRNSWVMGRVIQTFEDAKGRVRQAKVKTSKNILLRPVTKLCVLLECDM
ncbi:phylloquinone omega-hydroxylase/docosahexaenoic acid omega-hydroxylase [Sarotherodon galilaeus]